MDYPNQDIGIISYDVPQGMRNVYNAIMRVIRKVAIQDTLSCYLFPWGYKNRLEEAINNADQDRKVRWKIRKFDRSEVPALQKDVHKGFKKILRRTKRLLRKRLVRYEDKFAREELSEDQLKEVNHAARMAAKRELKKVRRLAVVFEMSDIMEAGFRALEGLIALDLADMDDPEKVAPVPQEAVGTVYQQLNFFTDKTDV